MNFAALESTLASVSLAAFANLTLSTGVAVFNAVMDRGVEFIGEYGLTGERRDRITVNRADAAEFATGLVLQADPNTYTTAELLAMERTSWTLDRIADDDGHLVSWWIK